MLGRLSCSCATAWSRLRQRSRAAGAMPAPEENSVLRCTPDRISGTHSATTMEASDRPPAAASARVFGP